MAVELGTSSTVEIDDNSGMTSAVSIGCLRNGSLTLTTDAVEVTCNDDAGVKAYLAGNTDGTLSFETYYDIGSSGDAGMDEVMDRYFDKGTVYFRVRPTVGTGKDQYVVAGVITNVDFSFANNEPVGMAVDVQVTGGSTRTQQT